ncbi:major facilitator superfamily domain-containing protein [Echria macrotheca]|uniref:Major facilitator superfamily domain-containing protein n=1 Tax=Echria macrotheca TaxID=438768 RepID=A0AAJ0BNT8_9PEZI|nr:major facilitator superfamily domain-containing protein [Echria macrotheca]
MPEMSALETTATGFPDRGPAVFAVTTATLVLASIFVAARLVSRIGIVRSVSWDDYIIVLAWLISFFLCLTIDFGTKRGLGRHDENISPDDMPGLRMCEYVFSILYNPALMSFKTSILIFYLRLAKNTQKILRLASWIVLSIVLTAGTILTFMNIFQCQPTSSAWDMGVRAEKCVPLLTEFICSAPVNITTDLAIMALPIPVITSMRLPPRQKTILVITFALGFFVTVVDVVRIYYLQQAITFAPTGSSSDTSAMFGQSAGFSWNASLSLMWSAVEVNVGITCACIPTLKPLIIRILPAIIVDPDRTRTSQTRGSQPESDSTKPTSTDNSQPGGTDEPRQDVVASPIPTPAPAEVRRSSDEMSIREFLSGMTPELRSAIRGSRQNTSSFANARVASTASTVPDRSVYFGFVNVNKPKSMLRASAAESFRYCTVVSVLFFLWGVSYGLLNTLNTVVAEVAHMTEAQQLGLTSVYFGGGYFFGPLVVAEWILRHDEHHRSKKREHNDPESVGGFKATFIVGLLIYGIGTIMFWPGAVLNSYGGFMASSFVVGFGLAVLETSANPFLALCGPPEYADARLLFAQAVQGVGSVLSGLLANNVFFYRIETRTVDSTTLLDVQWTYLAITLLCVFLALYFFYMPLPEVTDRELERLASKLPVDPKKRVLGGSLRTWCIILAVITQWTYIAAQENMSIYFQQLITVFATTPSSGRSYRPEGFATSALNYLLIAHTAFAVSRFVAGVLAYLSVRYPKNRFIPTPRTMLTASTGFSALFVLITVVMKPTDNPNLIAIPIILFFLAEGPVWPLTFSLGLRGQGKRTKRAAAWLTMGGSGPAFWPFVSYAIMRAGGSIQTSFIIVVVLNVASMGYPLFLTFVRDARAMVDPAAEGPPKWSERRGSEGTGEVTMEQILAARRRQAAKREARDAKGGTWKRMFPKGLTETEEAGERSGENGGEKGEANEVGRRDFEPATQAEPARKEEDQEAGIPPWERQALDTRILQD